MASSVAMTPTNRGGKGKNTLKKRIGAILEFHDDTGELGEAGGDIEEDEIDGSLLTKDSSLALERVGGKA